jgi:anti-anti-sigma factor
MESTPIPPQATAAHPSEEGLLTVRGMDNSALVFITTPTVHDHQAELIRARLLALAERIKGRIAVSLENVSDMSSAGINALVTVHTKCKDLGGSLAVFGMSRDIRKMLRVTKLDRTIVICETAHEAVTAISRPRKSGFWAALSWAKSEKDAA